MTAIKAEVQEASSAAGAAGGRNTSNKTGGASQMNRTIGSTRKLKAKNFWERNPGTLHFTGMETIDTVQTA